MTAIWMNWPALWKENVRIGSSSLLHAPTFDVARRHLRRFLQRTEALAILGYKNDVDWLKSTAFELLMLSEIQENEFSGRGIDAIKDRLIELAKQFREIDFRILLSKEVAIE